MKTSRSRISGVRNILRIALSFIVLTGSSGGQELTAPTGPSWLARRGLFMLDSSFGRIGNQRPGASPVGPGPRWPWPPLPQQWTLTGADLYRLNCRSCHNADGTGLPPEINSVLDPVRAASPALIKQRFEARGRPADPATIKELVKGARDSLLERFHYGGEKMPAYPHLSEVEVHALLDHLGRLAGTPEARGPEPRVVESLPHVGQLLVKGTCQICHDATGAGSYSSRDRGQLIPSLAAIVETKTARDVVQKVRTGSPTTQGHGEMPLFLYLTDQEVAAAYVYLVSYPPQAAPVH
jgi:mono/diheme cytochrome c family protein